MSVTGVTQGKLMMKFIIFLNVQNLPQERAELNDQITLICQNINNFDDSNRLLWILNNENSIILKALCQYMIKTGFK